MLTRSVDARTVRPHRSTYRSNARQHGTILPGEGDLGQPVCCTGRGSRRCAGCTFKFGSRPSAYSAHPEIYKDASGSFFKRALARAELSRASYVLRVVPARWQSRGCHDGHSPAQQLFRDIAIQQRRGGPGSGLQGGTSATEHGGLQVNEGRVGDDAFYRRQSLAWPDDQFMTEPSRKLKPGPKA